MTVPGQGTVVVLDVTSEPGSQPGQDQLSVDVDVAYADASGPARDRIRALQKKRAGAFAKDQGVSLKEFTIKVNSAARDLGYTKKDTDSFRTYMLDQYTSANEAAQGKPIPPADVQRMLAESITYDNVPYGYDVEHWRAVQRGTTGLPPAADQPERVKAILGAKPPPPVAAPGAPLRKVVKGKTYEKRGNEWFLTSEP